MILYRKTTSEIPGQFNFRGIRASKIVGDMVYGDNIEHCYGTTIRKEDAFIRVGDEYVPYLNIKNSSI
jgi:hypothetical protein